MSGANDIQHGGDHYGAPYQHWDFVADTGLDYYRGNATKYLARWRKKNGVEDVRKARHYVAKLLELIESGVVPKGAEPTPRPILMDELSKKFCEDNGLDKETTTAFRAVVAMRLLYARETLDNLLEDLS